jgi:CRISPR-associated protein Cas2
MQFSVFRCELNERERVVLRGLLAEAVDHDADQVMFVNLGPSEGRGNEVIETLGRHMVEKPRLLVM